MLFEFHVFFSFNFWTVSFKYKILPSFFLTGSIEVCSYPFIDKMLFIYKKNHIFHFFLYFICVASRFKRTSLRLSLFQLHYFLLIHLFVNVFLFLKTITFSFRIFFPFIFIFSAFWRNSSCFFQPHLCIFSFNCSYRCFFSSQNFFFLQLSSFASSLFLLSKELSPVHLAP